mmetsp:Transcript_7432/g.11105  ORF Transcript_7432/g.11105 Transcript_7432/m.11105 type:complete len:520 (-) Transcript_7432:15-1574(-)
MFKMKPHQIELAVYSMDNKVLNIEKVTFLRSIAPSTELLMILKSYEGPMENLDEVTQFMVTVAKIPRYTLRLESTLFIWAFFDDAKTLYRRIYVVIEAVKEIRESWKLQRILEAIIAIGNFLNEGTKNGDAKGIRLSSLSKLEAVKTLDKKKNFLHILSEWLEKLNPEILRVDVDLEHCEEATLWSLTDLKSEINNFNTGMKQVQNQLKASEMAKNKPPEDVFTERAKEFLDEAVKRLSELEESYDEALKSFEEVANMFGEDPDTVPSGDFFMLMHNFIMTLVRAENDNKQWRLLEEKRKRSEEKAAKAQKEKELRLAKKRADQEAKNKDLTALLEESDEEDGVIKKNYENIKANLVADNHLAKVEEKENLNRMPQYKERHKSTLDFGFNPPFQTSRIGSNTGVNRFTSSIRAVTNINRMANALGSETSSAQRGGVNRMQSTARLGGVSRMQSTARLGGVSRMPSTTRVGGINRMQSTVNQGAIRQRSTLRAHVNLAINVNRGIGSRMKSTTFISNGQR